MWSSMPSSYLPATTESIVKAQEAKDASESISILYRVLEDPSSSADALRTKELAITNLTNYLTKENRAEDLRNLLTKLRPFFALIPKAKTAKIVRGIIDAVAKIPGTSELQISLCKEMVEWTRAEKRTFLRQRIEARLAALLLENQEYTEALNLLSGLIKEVRRLDDKLLLVDIDLLESMLHFSLRNLPKAKASLTAARTAANAIYFTGRSEGISSLKCMLLCKIMVSQADHVAGIVSSKAGLKYLGPDVDAMKAVADASLKELIEPYSRVEIAHIAEMIELPIDHVEKKLSQMILDKKFAGTLDQGAGCLIIFEDPKTEEIFPATLETIANVGKAELRHRGDVVADGVRRMGEEKESLERRLQDVMMATDVLESWVMENNRTGDTHAVDDAIQPADVLSRQMIECTAADLALEDTVYALDKAVQEGSVPLMAYLRSVRALARKQFSPRALSAKVHSAPQQAKIASMAARAPQNLGGLKGCRPIIFCGCAEYKRACNYKSDKPPHKRRAEDLRNLLTKLRPFFALAFKAKTAKIVRGRGIIDAVAKIPGTSERQISLCKEMMEWTRAEASKQGWRPFC
ncbi:hypothetical protein EJB05_00518, partial [Eragrostis curvula]